MTSLSSAPPTPTPASSLSTSDLSERPRVNHGKPNLAPKPPVTAHAPDRPSPPLKKLIVNGKLAARAQSMRVPRYVNVFYSFFVPFWNLRLNKRYKTRGMKKGNEIV